MKNTLESQKAWRNKCALAAACVVLVARGVVAKSPRKSATPSDVVRQYCELDMEGARLSSQNPHVAKVFSLVTWSEEPGWDSATVIRGFEVVGVRAGRQTSAVTVRYEVLGEMSGVSVATSRRIPELVTFVVRRSETGWKIDRPLIRPHISADAAIAALNDLLRVETNAQRKEQLRDALAVLSQWAGGPRFGR